MDNHIFRASCTRLLTAARAPVLLSILLSTSALPPALQAAGTPGAGSPEIAEGSTADQLAAEHYQAGLAHKAAAWELESQATSTADAAEREQLLDSAQAEYQLAATTQGKALKLQLNHYQAANELGYALRQSGDYRKALGAYNFALQIKADFYPAIEYRGEAYLALGMIEQAKQAYMTLFRNDPALAAELLAAMAQSEEQDPAFKAWIVERQELAALTAVSTEAKTAGWTSR